MLFFLVVKFLREYGYIQEVKYIDIIVGQYSFIKFKSIFVVIQGCLFIFFLSYVNYINLGKLLGVIFNSVDQ